MFGSSWNANNNQQQQQQGTSAFGQPSAFGNGGAFGQSAFGQNNQAQQQQPVNPMFGNAATAPATTPSAGFGAFGGGNSAFASKSSAFGGFGGGGPSAFGGGQSAFGQQNQNASGSAFGQPAASTSAFGGGTSAFGQKPAASNVFGSTSGTVGTDNIVVPPVTTGSSNPPYQVFQEKDTSGATPVTLHYQSISFMPAYRGTSFEEIRCQDYAQGRKTAGGFGQPSAFGAPAAQQSTSVFGQPAASTSAFGAFGQNNQNTSQSTPNAFGAFGQQNASQPSAFGGGNTNAFGAFGQQNQQQQNPGTFGAFAQNNQQQQQQPSTSVFGGGSAFGQQNKPFGAFASSGPSAFGGGGSAFGQNNQQQQQQQQSGTVGFGQSTGQPAQTNAFGAFASKPPAFGQPASQPSAFGLLGQNQQNQQNGAQAQPANNLFGGGNNLFGQNQNQQQQTQPQTNMFGQTSTQPAVGNMFGGGTGNNLFGNNNQQKPAFGGSSAFGPNQNNTAGATTQPQTGLFGQPLGQSTSQTGTGTGAFGASSFFGAKPATTPGFGQSFAQPSGSLLGNNTGTGLFGGGASAIGQGAVQGGTLTASVAEPVQTSIPLFSLLQSSGPQSLLHEPPPKKSSSYFVDIPTRSPLALSTSRMGGRLRGFGLNQSAGLARNGLSSTMTVSSPLSLSKVDSKVLLGPEAFLGSSSIGADGKPSPKKLVLDKKIDPSDIFGRSPSKVSFNPAMSVAVREKEGLGYPSMAKATPSTAASPSAASPGKKSTPGAESTKEKDPDELQEGDYWVKPGLDVLRNLSNSELSSFKGLVVGRKGYGEIHFLEPVDLTALPRLSALLGKIVQIDSQECCVYPDSVDGDDLKPPIGEGINVKSRIILFGCWPLDKATREPIKDENHPSFIKNLKRLRSMKHTRFESFGLEDGRWTFTVDHF